MKFNLVRHFICLKTKMTEFKVGCFHINFFTKQMKERVSRITGADRDGPKRTFVDTKTDFSGYRNGPRRTGTDFRGYRNGLSGFRTGLEWIPKRTLWVQNRDSGCLK